jgi:hypothetical protein
MTINEFIGTDYRGYLDFAQTLTLPSYLSFGRSNNYWVHIESGQSQIYLTTDGQSVIFFLVWGHHSRPMTNFSFFLRNFFRQLRVCYFVAPSLTRWRVCHLQLLLGNGQRSLSRSEFHETEKRKLGMYTQIWSRDSLVHTYSYGLNGRGNTFLFSVASRPTLGPTQPPVPWVPGTSPWG